MSATIKGDEKVIEVNSVSGKNRRAEKAHSVATTRHPARAHWRQRLCVRRRPVFVQGLKKAATSRKLPT